MTFPSDERFASAQPPSRHARFPAKDERNEGSLSVFPASRGDVSPPTPAPAKHDQRVYVTEAPRIRDLDHSSRFKSETRGETSDGGTPGKNGESDVSRTIASDANSCDMPVRRPLRPW